MPERQRGMPQRIHSSASRNLSHGWSFFEVRASGFTHATPQQAWRVLTDYERLEEFVPDLVSSKVLSRSPHEAIIEQQNRAGFLFLSHTIRMVVRIAEQPFSALDVEQISGDMQHYSARWLLEPFELQGTTGTRIGFDGAIEPAFPLPPLVGDALVELNARKMVEAVIAEIDRRSMH